uniref:EngB-type G domain-containing protein n=1 Tax=Kalanchoe fedtschenkoi TaxID=63787 RepID=A0A7N0ZU53_KALFE
MSTETETGVARKLKLKLKLAINRSKSSNGNLSVKKGRILSGRAQEMPTYESRDDISVKRTFQTSGRGVGVKARSLVIGEFRKSSNLSGKFGRKSEFSRVGGVENGVRKGSSVEKSLRTIWVPSKNDGAGSEKKQSRWKGKGRSSDGNFSQLRVKKFNKAEAEGLVDFDVKNGKFEKVEDEGLAYRGDASLNKDLWRSRRKINVGGKIGGDGRSSEVVSTDEPLRKRKRIRIHRLDVSNKRIDDTIMSEENTKAKSEEADDKDITMSRNAQFRAIKPTPSILSFVEDNLLGRRRMIELQRAGYNINLSAPLDNIPNSTSTERERIEESLFRNRLEFYAAAKVASSFPVPDLPEVAFAGRSNVGKSSLLNALTRQWGVVRTSDKPGHTRTINFFKLGTKLNLVDLPGYGFAYAKEEVKDAWEELVKEYVTTRSALQRVCLLVDTKWGMKPRDHELIGLMEKSQTKYQIVLTKTDAVPPMDVARRAMQIEENLKANRSIVQPLMIVSSRSGAGIRCLRTALAKISRFVKV